MIIDFFYPPFQKWFSLHTFRYMASGGITVVTGIVVYYIIYNFILHQTDVQLGQLLITAPIAALILKSMFTFIVGFMLNKYLVFTQSDLKGRVQLFRYATVYGTNILLNYALMKILVEGFLFYPTIAKAIITILLAVFSYFSQKYFSLGSKNNKMMNNAIRLALLVLAMVFTSQILLAQTNTGLPSFQIKVSPFRLIDLTNPGFELGIEKTYAKKHASQVSVAYMKNLISSNAFHDYGGWRFSAEQKFFIDTKKPLKYYVSAEFAYLKVAYQTSAPFHLPEPADAKSYTDHFNIKKRNTIYNLKYGVLIPLNRFVFDVAGGVGIKNRNVHRSGFDHENAIEITPRHPNVFFISNKESNKAVINIPINIKVGYAL